MSVSVSRKCLIAAGILICLFSFPDLLRAQWTDNGGTVYYNGGWVGIGTNHPFGQLTVTQGVNHDLTLGSMDWTGVTGSVGLNATNDANSAFIPLVLLGSKIVMSAGNVGIGTTNPLSELHTSSSSGIVTIGGGLAGTVGGGGQLRFRTDSGSNDTVGGAAISGLNQWGGETNGQAMNLGFYTNQRTGQNVYTGLTQRMLITSAGNVGIGTQDPQYPLSVNGVIQAKEIIVNTGWSDYVFDSGYQLRTLGEVARYIEANHHLPDMPSAAEVKGQGVSVGQMESKLLAKVEELTLQMIQMNEENKRLQERLDQLEKR